MCLPTCEVSVGSVGGSISHSLEVCVVRIVLALRAIHVTKLQLHTERMAVGQSMLVPVV